MQVSRCLGAWCICTAIRSFSDNFSYCMKRQSYSLLVLFWGYFLLKPCKMRDFGCLKDKNREKDKGKGRGGCEGSRIFLGDGGEGFLVLFWFVFLGFGRGGG